MNEESQLGPSQDGTVMLDIGGDVGALIIHTSVALAGSEIELSVVGTRAPRTHVAVRERRGVGPTRYAAIYPSLPARDYTVWGHDGEPAGTVAIAGGRVSELDWR
ncbi:MAG: phospholipase [Actinomycetota bacterium]|nr:phospholipase [Actinomycetota bacterium]